MDRHVIFEQIRDATLNFEIEKLNVLLMDALEAGIPANEILLNGLTEAMNLLGKKYEAREVWLSELMMGGETVKTGVKVLEPYLATDKKHAIGTVVIGTVQGDIHDIGKNIVSTLLQSSGFEVYDLGIDVPTRKFIKKVRETNADILALSALTTTTMEEMKNVIKSLQRSGLRQRVKVIVGGCTLSEGYAEQIGADGYGRDAFEGIRMCKEWVAEKQKVDESTSE